MKHLVFTVLIIIAGSIFSHAQITKIIVPMRSTCEDVKRILGVETCRKSLEIYDLEAERMEISYSIENCPKAYLKNWNVAKGTVLSVISFPKKPITLNDIPVDLTACNKYKVESDIPNETKYSCRKDGTSFSLVNGYVTSIVYTPTLEDSKLIRKRNKCEIRLK